MHDPTPEQRLTRLERAVAQLGMVALDDANAAQLRSHVMQYADLLEIVAEYRDQAAQHGTAQVIDSRSVLRELLQERSQARSDLPPLDPGDLQ
jgi:hypothetical protein